MRVDRRYLFVLCLVAWAALFSVACESATHELFVDLQTDLRPGVDFDRVRVEVFREGALSELVGGSETAVSAVDEFDTGRRVAEMQGLASGSYAIRVELSASGSVVISERATFELDGDRAITVHIDASCLGVACGTADACVNGGCGPSRCLIEPSVAGCPLGPDGGAGDAGSSDAGPDDAGPPADGAVIAPTGMVYVPAGAFMMGCNASLDVTCEPDEFPYHEVTLDAFFIDQREVAQREYALCLAAGVCAQPARAWDPSTTPDDPVVDVDRAMAETYCVWAGKRLPTEAEWEKAARGSDGRVYPWGNDPPSCALANHLVCGNRVDRVDSFAGVPSPYGTINMAGNVWEWVSDYYQADYYASSPDTNPRGPASGVSGVIRGGSFDWEAHALRASRRLEWDHAEYVIGVRCAQDP